MQKFRVATSIAVLTFVFTAPAFAQTAAPGSAAGAGANAKISQADCQSIWGKANASGSGALTSAQAQPYVSNFKSVDSNADGKLSSAEFLAGCQKGMVHDSASSGSSAGTSGESNPATPPRSGSDVQ